MFSGTPCWSPSPSFPPSSSASPSASSSPSASLAHLSSGLSWPYLIFSFHLSYHKSYHILSYLIHCIISYHHLRKSRLFFSGTSTTQMSTLRSLTNYIMSKKSDKPSQIKTWTSISMILILVSNIPISEVASPFDSLFGQYLLHHLWLPPQFQGSDLLKTILIAIPSE